MLSSTLQTLLRISESQKSQEYATGSCYGQSGRGTVVEGVLAGRNTPARHRRAPSHKSPTTQRAGSQTEWCGSFSPKGSVHRYWNCHCALFALAAKSGCAEYMLPYQEKYGEFGTRSGNLHP